MYTDYDASDPNRFYLFDMKILVSGMKSNISSYLAI